MSCLKEGLTQAESVDDRSSRRRGSWHDRHDGTWPRRGRLHVGMWDRRPEWREETTFKGSQIAVPSRPSQ